MRLKRLQAPAFWRVPKKTKKWVVAPSPGPHKKFESVPLAVVLRDLLHLVSTGEEARTIVKAGEILVDGKKRKDYGYPVGLFDVVSIPKTGQYYRAVPGEKGLKFIIVPSDEADKKISKVVDKTTIRKGKLQLNLNDGKNILVDKTEYKTGDSLLLQIPKLKILEHVKLEKGKLGIVTKGVNAGKIGTVKSLVETKTRGQKASVDFDGSVQEILVNRFVIVGDKKPLITLGE